MTRGFTPIGATLGGDWRPFRTMLNQSSKALTTNLGKWKQQLGGFNNTITGVLGAAGFGVALRELDRLGEGALRFGDSIGKAARQAGIGADALQEYREAAELTGGSQKVLDDAFGRFTRRLGEARRGNKAYADEFAQLGVTINDTNEQALEKTFDVLEDIENITIRTSVATKVFGDDARAMALIVGDSAGALDRMREAARAGGRVLREDLVAVAEDAQDRITLLNRTLDVELNTTVLENIDGFIQWRQLLNDIQIAFIELGAAVGNLTGQYRRFLGLRASDDIRDLRIQYADLGLEIDKTRERLDKLQNKRTSFFKGVNDANLRNIAREQEKLNELTEKRVALLEEINALQRGNGAQGAGGDTPPRGDTGAVGGINPPTPSLGRSGGINPPTPRLKSEIEGLTAATNDWRLANENAGRSIADAFGRAIVYGENLGDSLKRLAKQLASRAITNFLFQAAGNALGLPFGGFRAAGGPVSPGRAFVVGERGPELFMPNTAGQIIPNGMSMGESVSVVVNQRFDVGLESVDQRIAQTVPALSAAVVEGLDRARRRPQHA